MQAASRAVRAGRRWLTAARPVVMARVRLFILLLLLAPLFAGLEYLVQEGVPRVEIRFVSEDAPVVIPVERIIERIVERVVYVPAAPEPEGNEAAPAQPTATPAPTATATPGADAGSNSGPVAGRPSPRAEITRR